jgi:hypothetical protein
MLGDGGWHGGLLGGKVGDGDEEGSGWLKVEEGGVEELKLFLLLLSFSKSLFFLGVRVGVLLVLSLVFEGLGTPVL